MNCLIVAATAMEISGFVDHCRKNQTAFPGTTIDILVTGIGLTAATYSLAKQFNLKRPGLVIQAGIGGCFDNNISLGSVVAVKQDTIADQSVVESKTLKTLFDLNLLKRNQFPYKNGWLVNPDKKISGKYKTVSAVSINQITTNRKMINFYKDVFNPAIESMEGAALHYVCLSEKIPFLQLRSVSNYVGERNKKNWKLKESIHHLNNELILLLESL